MPHKHTRKGLADKDTLDLPPTSIAKPLSVSRAAKENGIFTTDLNTTRKTNKKRKHNPDINDDTPKAFARLMMFQQGKKLPKGLDDGIRAKKPKVNPNSEAEGKERIAREKSKKEKKEEEKAVIAKAEVPTIKPGERMSEFSARVDAALPVSGLMNRTAKGGKDPLGLKVGRTYKEKKMHKMYAQWREEEKRIQDKRMDARDMEEMQSEDENGQVVWKDMETATAGGKKKKGKKNKKKKLVGEVEDFEGDPWAKLKRDRGEEKIGFNDIAQAPPTFKQAPKEKFKVRGARVEVENVPKASGSLRRREELGQVRQSVVEGYRKMMQENKAKFADHQEE